MPKPSAQSDSVQPAAFTVARPQPRSEGRQVRQLGVPRWRRLTIVAVPAPPVLVGNVAPAEVRERFIRNDPERLEWVHALRSDGTEVGPVVAEVEDVVEPFAESQPAESSLAVVDRWP